MKEINTSESENLKAKIAQAREAHRSGEARSRMHQRTGGTYIGDVVYGANDGIVTTFAVVAGVAGAALSPKIVLILGFANLIADGISMAVGNFLGTKSENEYHESERKVEEWEVEHIPDEERAEIREIYQKKGFTGADLDRAVAIITSDKKQWVDEMMIEELNILPDGASKPYGHALATFIAFVSAGFLPLVPYVLGLSFAWSASVVMTGVAMFVVGSLRTYVTGKQWWRSGFEMLAVGVLTAVSAYGIGWWIERLLN